MNRLANETSLYLLQHSHNPVDWYPWGDEAFAHAKEHNLPVLVSVGYAACHWCHVMERESFENEATAAIMNTHFVNIKVDREERADVDHFLMDALQAMSGSGGWPLNMFLTPDGKPFYGGTYFPPVEGYGRPSWPQVLLNIADAYSNRKNEIEEQADYLVNFLNKTATAGIKKNIETDTTELTALMGKTVNNLLQSADKEWGGFGRAPKFPQSFAINFLLRFSHFTEKTHHFATAEHLGKAARQQALLSLDKMCYGGIYDQLGGGFCRYATDDKWLVPHFEKMLYDNALLLQTLAEAFALTGNPLYQKKIDETVNFLTGNLRHEKGGFYCALDADSEGEEGKYYVWKKAEVDNILGEDSPLFGSYYDITAAGNWEHTNILQVLQPAEQFAAANNISVPQLETFLGQCREKLLAGRNKRIPPATDDKILLSWNALLVTGLANAAAATGNKYYADLAVNCAGFLLDNLSKNEASGLMYRTWKGGKAKIDAFIDDYAFLIQALTTLAEVTGATSYLVKAKKILEHTITSFSDEKNCFFYFTPGSNDEIPVKKTEIYDGALPSGNAVMAQNLHKLGLYFNEPLWIQRCYDMLHEIQAAAIQYPQSFGIWASLLLEKITGTVEIAITGTDTQNLHSKFLKYYIPNRIIMVKNTANAEKVDAFPLLAGKPIEETPKLYICSNFSCKQPVESVEEAYKLALNA